MSNNIFNHEFTQKYWEGNSNKFVRYWMYFRLANGSVNEFKSYAYVLTGIYLGTPYLQQHIFVAGIALIMLVTISTPIMILFGRWLLHRAAPASEFVSATKGSVYGFKGIEATIETSESTKEILKEIKELKTNINSHK